MGRPAQAHRAFETIAYMTQVAAAGGAEMARVRMWEGAGMRRRRRGLQPSPQQRRRVTDGPEECGVELIARLPDVRGLRRWKQRSLVRIERSVHVSVR